MQGAFELIGVMRADVRQTLEAAGVVFQRQTGPWDEPGPTQWAAVSPDDDDIQFLLVSHHHDTPRAFVEVRGQVGTGAPSDLCERFARALDLDVGAYSSIESAWP